MTGRQMWTAWLLSRAFVWLLLLTKEHAVIGDVRYYDRSLGAIGDEGIGGVLVEYPFPGMGLIMLPWSVVDALGWNAHFWIVVGLLATATDAAFMWLVDRYADTSPESALSSKWARICWLAAVPMVGATTYARFDLVPGVLVGVGVLILASYPRLAGVSVGVATALKFWPAVVLPALVVRSRERVSALVAIGLTGLVLAGTSIAIAGWDRLVSPFSYQSDRGLQIESILATPLMLWWGLDEHRFRVFFSDFKAFEIEGTASRALAEITEQALPVYALLMIGLWVFAALRGRHLAKDAVVWLALTGVMGFIVTSKVLSPQYMLWLLPAAAAGLAVVETARGRSQLLRWAKVLLVASLLTQVIFPLFYVQMMTHYSPGTFLIALVLLVRNLLLLWLFVITVGEAIHHIRSATGPSTSDPTGAAGRAAPAG